MSNVDGRSSDVSGDAPETHVVTRLIEAMGRGDEEAGERLIGLVYEELKRMAASKMAREDADHTLQPTALVHEAWLRISGAGGVEFESRVHFFSVAAEAMRRILIESARRKLAAKRGSRAGREILREDHWVTAAPAEEVLAVHEALGLLAIEDRALAELVSLRYFAGMTMDEAAETLGLTVRTAERMWTYGRAWLRKAIGDRLPRG
ncbi:MAG: RNA polymerase subunit sigma [Verrucomicrobiae bacterium]|nr:RNA polymerase subunit sigma [Verrucomicrobiae bacterium]